MNECSKRDAEEQEGGRAVILELEMEAEVKSFTRFFPLSHGWGVRVSRSFYLGWCAVNRACHKKERTLRTKHT